MNMNRIPRAHQINQRRVDNDRGGRSSQIGRVGHRFEPLRQLIHRKFESYTPLAVEMAQILNVIANESYLKRPNPITHDPNINKTRLIGHTNSLTQKK